MDLPSDNPITEVYLDPSNETVALVFSGGDGGIFLVNSCDSKDVTHVPGNYRRVWP